MDLIILNDGMYSLVPVTKAMLELILLYLPKQIVLIYVILLRLKLSTYARCTI